MDDRKLIHDYGGPARMAEILGYDKKKGGVQRVQNWLTRGIPAKVKLSRPEIFLRGLNTASQNQANLTPSASTDSTPPAEQATA